MIKEKNLKINAFLNIFKSLLAIVFPIITYKYAAKVLLPEGIGKYDYVMSIIGYFQLVATLGVNTYAITEGSKIRENKEALNRFCSEMLMINIISTLFAYILLFLFVLAGSFDNCKTLILICSLTILFNTMGINWIYNIVEDFLFVTLRTVFFQIVSVILLVILVKSPGDINTYAWLTVISSCGANICNIYFSRKTISISFSKSTLLNAGMHMKPILLLFCSSAASTTYMNSDKTMLGVFSGDYYVGIYSTSVKIVSVITVIIVAFRDVLLPRLSNYLANDNKKEAISLMYKGLSLIYMFIIPCIIGIIMLRNELVIFISSIDYLGATNSLSILCIELLFAPISAFVAYQILIPMGRVSVVTIATIAGAIVNIGLNFLLIPFLQEKGAAITTVLAEFVVFIILYKEVRKQITFRKIIKEMIQYSLNALIIIPIILISGNIQGTILRLFISISLSIFVYVILLAIEKNPILEPYFKKIRIIVTQYCRVKKP